MVIYGLHRHGFGSVLPVFFTVVLISVAAVVPGLSFKNTQVVKPCLQVPHVGNSGKAELYFSLVKTLPNYCLLTTLTLRGLS